MITANMDGSDKRRLLAIGRFEKPRCFSGVKQLPVLYTANKKSWMTSAVFEDYVKKLDVEMTREKRKILLVVDNCPAHPVVENLQSVRLIFLPPNTTSHTQPMDAGVIRCFKAHYRKLLLMKMIRELDAGRDFNPDLYLAMSLAAQAWDNVSPQTIYNCFRHCDFVHASSARLPEEDQEKTEQDLGNIFEKFGRMLSLAPGVTVRSFLLADSQTAVCAQANEEDIIHGVTANPMEKCENVEDNDDSDPRMPVRPCEAAAAIDTLQLFLAQREIDSTEFKLNKLASVVSNEWSSSALLSQSKITDFFHL